jgi:hypothetical protein
MVAAMGQGSCGDQPFCSTRPCQTGKNGARLSYGPIPARLNSLATYSANPDWFTGGPKLVPPGDR